MEDKRNNIEYIFTTFFKWFLLILFFAVLGISIAIFYNASAPIKYESTTTLYVDKTQNDIETYVEIIKSRKVLNKVKDNLNLKVQYEDLIKNVKIKQIKDTKIIKITVRSETPKKAKDITNNISKVFIKEINSSTKVIDEAIINKKPVLPNENLNIAIGLISGIILGILVSFILESNNHKIKNHNDVKKYLNIKTIGVIPNNNIDNKNKKQRKYQSLNNKTYLKIINEPYSVISETFKMIRTNLNFKDLKVINMISTVPSEGKTETLTNIAVSFAMLGKKVLIMDCDLRKPKVHRIFGLSRKDGITDIILSKGKIKYKDVFKTFNTGFHNIKIDLLSAGNKISNPSELISSKRFQMLIEEVKTDYDLVLIDCPPISVMTDGILVSKLSDGAIYVIESDRTDYEVVNTCIEQLKNNKVFVLGAILTKVNVKTQKKLYGYKYNYYYTEDKE